jgi:hypothetical protein
MARGSLMVQIDPASLQLINACATALGDAGLDYYLDDLVDRGAFREALSSRVELGVIVIGLGPYTELLLHECIDVARRRGWSKAMRSRWIEQVIEVAGFGT